MANYATRDNADLIEQLYQQYLQNPQSVSTDWRKFFEGMEFGSDRSFATTSGLSEKELHVYDLINAYRNYGHFEAQLDPLSNSTSASDELSLKRFQLSEADLDQQFQIGAIIGLPGGALRDIIQHLRNCYCGPLTVQVAEALPEVRNWFIREFEQKEVALKFTPEIKKSLLKAATQAEAFEKFLHTRYVGAKRFSIEGADASLLMMEWLAEKSTQLGAQEVVLGMAHRGRLNVLVNFMQKGPEYIFAEYNGLTETAIPIEDFDGDVKYHLGYQNDRPTQSGPLRISLAFNPSHLEAVNPVVLGMTRAAQRRRKDTEKRKTVIPVLIHGEAAFSSQGVVLETFQMAHVKGYTVGGTIHLSIDNQVGFTTNPENGRSSHYPTDASKVLHTPVLHVNGDNAEACIRAMDMAVRFRQEWSRDIVINMVCYRRFGHNEGDEPAYTQPLMYDIIKKHPTLREIYGKTLVKEGVYSAAEVDGLLNAEMDRLQKIYENTKVSPPKIEPFKFDGYWKGLRKAKAEDFDKTWDTTFPIEKLKAIADKIGQVPASFNPHPKLLKLLEYRRAVAKGEQALDWGTAELLAYGSILEEGNSVRLTGQDCVRGTFTHRHSALYDVKTGEKFAALDDVNGDKVEFCVYDSILSEYGVLGFEYGNAAFDPQFLTLWEAQFGDFANGAQIIIDQFLAAGESKWQQMCGLVLLLPHGYEGQGPEHSSARLERFLQICGQLNMQVVNLTTPAQIYHALRRQMRRPFRKPLVVMSPKSLLRHPTAVSSLKDLAEGTFQEVIPETRKLDPKKVETVALCSGKIYYELLEEAEKAQNTRTAIVRIEQLYPCPTKTIAQILKSYPSLKSIVWCQEEPKNMGAYQFVYFKLSEMMIKEGLTKLAFHYIGRNERSSPATGSLYKHKAEQSEIVKSCFKI